MMRVHLNMVDVAAQARLLYGPRADELLPPGAEPLEHDWRFELTFESGARATMHRGATAEHVAAYVERESRR